MSLNNGDHKVHATILIVDWARAFARAIDAHGHEFFIFSNAIEQTGRYRFEDLRTGTTVKLTPIDHPKGLRGIEVQILEL